MEMKFFIHDSRKLFLLLLLSVSVTFTACANKKKTPPHVTSSAEKVDLFQLSKNFYNAVKKGNSAGKYIEQLNHISKESLENQLTNNTKKKAFWLNIYNTYVQYLLKENPDLYKDRSSFFKDERFTIAGEKMSLDDVEHGMIRDSRVKLSYGHLKDPFASKFEKKFRVSEVDWRIHFALNCGAKSCPPVSFYKVETLDEQLEKSAQAYLKREVKFNQKENKVYVPRLMDWFRADFEGKDGIIKILKNYQLIPTSSDPEVEFLDYNWELDLDNYSNNSN
ncbi:MAG: hypothetical protein CMH15_09450 [Mesonia sp.]|nr:hypothetical protein [Mesonia sp.]MAQ41251.1 hypothetical protein [Mesonia sp.]MBJ97350.1 hypothetical protein [Flavobacteriaceae bacterium]|tara:strand:+ start:20658 stop:21491 length:834 start_codon:yes stop_codon:yes gene_type:complete